ncbi:hypothetical protein RYH70_01585 [Alloalcanivorax xenomutans]|jgi:hypothetical protein|uniref:Uncharacterized protein n=1 Tax=Alloalcanivorax balearicus MACL04 TaxID=1177182 RepID=A0ABT2R086_9GAMM|nr:MULTISPECIES: hypothetical protein [Alloalcanivorax]ERS10719.1 hypothetical protein Q668_03790 [Alcanivorax sp. PN-3]MCU5783173.1 hypothetical protein [Alloalcanivorax balearicus MACL04]WOD28758.1 hypothetical protein RYH70_01585 [Alloalcanivorax xenomutans]
MDKGYLFKSIWRGWFVGMTVTFVPFILLWTFVRLEASLHTVLMVFMVPVVAALQGVFVGGLVLLGLTIWPMERPGK